MKIRTHGLTWNILLKSQIGANQSVSVSGKSRMRKNGKINKVTSAWGA
jgi:hypothetical protein